MIQLSDKDRPFFHRGDDDFARGADEQDCPFTDSRQAGLWMLGWKAAWLDARKTVERELQEREQ